MIRRIDFVIPELKLGAIQKVNSNREIMNCPVLQAGGAKKIKKEKGFSP